MSYPSLSEWTIFPDELMEMKEYTDVSNIDLENINTYYKYLDNDDLESAKTFLTEHPEFKNYMVMPEDINKIMANIIAAQMHSLALNQQIFTTIESPMEYMYPGDVWLRPIEGKG